MDNCVHFKASIDRFIKTNLYDDDEMLNIVQENVSGEILYFILRFLYARISKLKKNIERILSGSGQSKRSMQVLQSRFGNERQIIQTNIASLKAHTVVQ